MARPVCLLGTLLFSLVIFSLFATPSGSEAKGNFCVRRSHLFPLGRGYDAIRGSEWGVGRDIIDIGLESKPQSLPETSDPDLCLTDEELNSLQVQLMIPPLPVETLEHSVFQTPEDVANSLSLSSGLPPSSSSFMTQSPEVVRMEKEWNMNFPVSRIEWRRVMYEAMTKPFPLFNVSSEFRTAVMSLAELSTTATSDSSSFSSSFLRSFGTHYRSATQIGAKAVMDCFPLRQGENSSSSLSSSQLLDEAKKRWSSLTAEQPESWEEEKGDGDVADVKCSVRVEGGDDGASKILSQKDWMKWRSSTNWDNAVIIGHSLDSLSSAAARANGYVSHLLEEAVEQRRRDHAVVITEKRGEGKNSVRSSGWCNCYADEAHSIACSAQSWWYCMNLGCTKEGYFLANVTVSLASAGANSWVINPESTASKTVTCCQPC